MNDQRKMLDGFSLATSPICGSHKYPSGWLTLDNHFVKTLLMVFVVHSVCSLLVVSTRQCVNSLSLEEQYYFYSFVCLYFVCCTVSLSLKSHATFTKHKPYRGRNFLKVLSTLNFRLCVIVIFSFFLNRPALQPR